MSRRGFIDPIERLPDPQCEVCGHEAGDCVCPECPECGEAGNPRCYVEHGLRALAEDLRRTEQEAGTYFALLTLVRLHDHTKREDPERYEREKPVAWRLAREALTAVDGVDRSGREEADHEQRQDPPRV